MGDDIEECVLIDVEVLCRWLGGWGTYDCVRFMRGDFGIGENELTKGSSSTFSVARA